MFTGVSEVRPSALTVYETTCTLFVTIFLLLRETSSWPSVPDFFNGTGDTTGRGEDEDEKGCEAPAATGPAAALDEEEEEDDDEEDEEAPT